MSGEVLVESPNATGEILDPPTPHPADPMPDPAPQLPLPPIDSDPLPAFEDPAPEEDGLVPDLDGSSRRPHEPLIRPVSFQASSEDGAPVLKRVPRID